MSGKERENGNSHVGKDSLVIKNSHLGKERIVTEGKESEGKDS